MNLLFIYGLFNLVTIISGLKEECISTLRKTFAPKYRPTATDLDV